MEKRKALLSIFIIFLITGCGALKTYNAKYSLKKTDTPVGKLSDYGNYLANKFGIMALFSEAVYRRSSDLDSKLIISKCGDANSIDANYLMPWAKVNGRKYSWSRLFNSETNEAEPCYSGGGLYYETYVLRNDKGTILEAVIAYRGTDGFKEDMITNVAAAVGFEPPQYAAARIRLKTLTDYLMKSYSGIKIYAVGHSLGGGLAQQAGYLSKDISEVYAFNTSPVTNWSSIVLDNKIEKHYPVIYRVNHGGEILGPIRFITTSFTSTRFNRYDITFQVTEKKLISGHAMKIIACSFAEGIKQLSKENAIANHFYGKQYIDEKITGSKNKEIANNNLCKKSNTN